MSPIEAFREGLRNGGGYMDCTFRQLEGAISELESERDAAKDRAEKAEAELGKRVKDYLDQPACCHEPDCGCRGVTIAEEIVGVEMCTKLGKIEAENYALRKALEQSKNGVDLAHGYLVQRNLGDPAKIAAKALESTRAVIDAALHGTAKQEQFCPKCNYTHKPGYPCHVCLGDLMFPPQEPKPRTCGECAHYKDGTGRCHSMISTRTVTLACDLAPIECFQPRADAQKGANE